MAISTETAALPRRWSPPRGGLVLLLFLASGFAGLTYEVLWTRMLTYVFGSSLYAVSTVLAAFMGGLALGSFLFGRWVDGRRNPLRIYAAIEIGIALSALAVPVLLRVADPIFHSFYASGDPSLRVLKLVRLALTFGVLLIPTTLMGATLPVLSKWSGRVRGRLGLSLGVLYTINTLGAVAGCYVTGFHGIATLGVKGMLLVGVAVNAAVGVAAFALSALPGSEVEPQPAEPESVPPETPGAADEMLDDVTPLTARMVFWFYGISGAVALAYQVTWSRSLLFSFDVLKNTTYAFTAMLTVFLIGLAAGSALMSFFADRLPEPVRCFSLVQLGIGLMGAFSFLVIIAGTPALQVFQELSEDQTQVYFAGVVANIFIKTGSAIFLPTLLMGMAYPVAVRICVPSLARVGRTVGNLYSINTVGAIVGALGAGFFLIPSFGIPWTFFLLSLVSLTMAVVLTLNLETIDPVRRYFVVGLAALCALVLLVRFPFNAEFHKPEPTERRLYYEEGPLATVSVMQNMVGECTLYVDKVGVAGTDRILLTDQKSLAHVPMLFLDNPTSALTVGFGSGGASWSYLQYASLGKLDCVEICKTVLRASRFLTVSNQGLWARADRRYTIIIDDVRSYLRFSPKRYDIIATDCTDLRYKTNANLYDVEYFRLCRDRVTSDGMVVAWMPLGGLSTDTLRLALRTFYKVFPDFAVWYMNNEPTHYILLVGTPSPLRIDYRRMWEKIEKETVREGRQTVKEDLYQLLLDNPDKILSCYLTNGKALAADLAADDRVNSENHPYLEFEAPRYGYSERPLFDNLDYLLSKVNSIEPYLKPGTYEPADLERIRKYRSAVPHILEGHEQYRRMNIEKATREYMKAAALCPEDAATSRLLRFEAFQMRVEIAPGDLWARYQLARSLVVQKRNDEAISRLRECLRIGKALRDRNLDKETIENIQGAAALLRGIYEEQGNKEQLDKLATLMKDLPTTPSGGNAAAQTP